jgi:hypothetical protein
MLMQRVSETKIDYTKQFYCQTCEEKVEVNASNSKQRAYYACGDRYLKNLKKFKKITLILI